MSETRRLQRIGGNTLYVSLPKYWTKRMKLQQGDSVTLTSRPDGSIAVYPAIKPHKSKEIFLKINPKDPNQFLRRGIIAAYVDGFDVIKLEAKDRFTEKQQNVIRETIDHLFASELIEVTGNSITIQCLLRETLPIEKNLRRIHNILLAMFRETIFALKKEDLSLVEGLTRRKHDIERLSLVTIRSLRSVVLFPEPIEQIELSLIDCVDYLQILHIISEITENVYKILENVMALNKKALPKHILGPLCEACIRVQALYDRSIQALLSKDVLEANDILDSESNIESLWHICKKANEKSQIGSLTLAHVYLLIDNVKQIQQYSSEIAEIAIDRTEAELKRVD